MTTVGKVLIVLILIMSLVFMSFTVMVYATHRNWKELVENPTTGLKSQLVAKQRELQQLESQRQEVLDQLAYEKATRTEALAVLEVKRIEMEDQLSKKEQELQSLQKEASDALRTLDTNSNELQRLKDEVGQLRVEIKQTRQDRNDQVAAVRKSDRSIESR